MSNFWANSDAGRHGVPGAVMSEGERAKWEAAQDLIRARTRIAELEAELAGVRACLVEHGQRLADVITRCSPPSTPLYPWHAEVLAAATGDTT